MDSLTHALAAGIVFALIGHPELVPFAMAGAVAPDVDAAFQRFSDHDPRLYLFTHGGITHSFPGALVVSALAAGLTLIAAAALGYDTPVVLAFVAAAAGVLTHVTLDFMAYPGIPLLYPATDNKYTLGILGGPTPYLLVASLVFGAFILEGKASLAAPWLYVWFFALVLAASVLLKAFVTAKAGRRAIPGFNPLRWLIVAENHDYYEVSSYRLFRSRSPGVRFAKLQGVSPEEVRSLGALPEVRRLRYNSYVVTAERNERGIVLSDPLRKNGYIWYPPYYTCLEVPVQE